MASERGYNIDSSWRVNKKNLKKSPSMGIIGPTQLISHQFGFWVKNYGKY